MNAFEYAIVQDIRWVAIAIVGVLSASRLSRLITWDSYPPVVWLRIKWDAITNDGPWSLLVHCGYCFAVWSWALVLGWGILSDFNTAWWIFNGWMAGAYVAAMIQSNDGED